MGYNGEPISLIDLYAQMIDHHMCLEMLPATTSISREGMVASTTTVLWETMEIVAHLVVVVKEVTPSSKGHPNQTSWCARSMRR
jgi:hypothetical protein